MTATNAPLIARGLATWVEDWFLSLEALSDVLSTRVTADFEGEPPFQVRPQTRTALGRDVAEFLGSHPAADGAGLIFQLSQLESESARLEWWVRDGDAVARRDFILDPASDRFYDYEYLEWFQGGFDAATRTLAGPYIDHLGIDDYVATFTVPFFANGRKVGVAGADLLMNDVESEILRILAPLPGCALLSRHNQVLVGNSAQLSTGVRVAIIPPGYSQTPLDVEHVGLSLLHPVQ